MMTLKLYHQIPKLAPICLEHLIQLRRIQDLQRKLNVIDTKILLTFKIEKSNNQVSKLQSNYGNPKATKDFTRRKRVNKLFIIDFIAL